MRVSSKLKEAPGGKAACAAVGLRLAHKVSCAPMLPASLVADRVV